MASRLMGVGFISDQLCINQKILYEIIQKSNGLKRVMKVIAGQMRFAWPETEPIFRRIVAKYQKEIDDRVHGRAPGAAPGRKVDFNPDEEPAGNLKPSQRKQLEDEDVDDLESETVTTYSDARAEREKYAAKQAKIDYERKLGKLIPTTEVKKLWNDIAISVQKAVLTVPDRIAPLLVGETDQFIIHQRIANELKYALKNLSFELTQDGEGNTILQRITNEIKAEEPEEEKPQPAPKKGKRR